MSDALGSLERLARLRDAGTLTEEEFLAQKAKILDPAEPVSADTDLVSEQRRRAGAEKRHWIVTRNGRLIVAAALLSVAAIGATVHYWDTDIR